MNKNSFLYRAIDLYYDGFRHMTLGKTRWAVILIKLFIIFVVLKLFFFPNYIKSHAGSEPASSFVSDQVIKRAHEVP